MRQRPTTLLVLIPLLVGAGAPAATVPAAGAPAAIEAAFRHAAAISRSPRSGDIYTLPQAYNYVVEPEYAQAEVSHLTRNGRTTVINHHGTSHGTPWQYDTRIPLVFYGPGLVKANQRPTLAATQEDLPSTYAWLLGVQPPRDAQGRALTEAFEARHQAPKAILTLLIDQGGRNLYDAHPDSYPNIKRLMAQGTDFVNAEVTHLESETALGHVAVGTGAYPDRTGIPANFFFFGGSGAKAYSFQGEKRPSPLFQESPTFGDHWLRATNNQAILISQCYSDRAAMGMAGHGSYYKGNKKPYVVFYDEKAGKWATNTAYYELPGYLSDMSAQPYWQGLVDKGGKWLGHDVANPADMRRTPAYVRMDGDAFVRMIDHEPIGADNIADLLYLTLKSTDAAGHQYGFESDEDDQVFRETDRQVGRIVAALEAKVGKGNLLVALTADHGGTPLTELSGGVRMMDDKLIAMINERFAKSDARFPVALYATNTQVWLDEHALAAQGASRWDVIEFLRQLKVNGKSFYRLVVDSADIQAEQAALAKAAANRRRPTASKPVLPASHR